MHELVRAIQAQGLSNIGATWASQGPQATAAQLHQLGEANAAALFAQLGPDAIASLLQSCGPSFAPELFVALGAPFAGGGRLVSAWRGPSLSVSCICMCMSLRTHVDMGTCCALLTTAVASLVMHAGGLLRHAGTDFSAGLFRALGIEFMVPMLHFMGAEYLSQMMNAAGPATAAGTFKVSDNEGAGGTRLLCLMLLQGAICS